jgi:hypothetical protein
MPTIPDFRRLVALVAFVLASGFAPEVAAAPQALGLVASSEPLPLLCEGSECQAHLSAFCLQERRDIPPLGTVYQLVTAAAVKLVLTTAAGETIEVPAAGAVSFTVYRSYTAIRASVPSRLLAARGALAAALVIESDALLMPRAEAADPKPQTTADVDLATGRLRSPAVAFFDSRGDEADAAKLVNRLINALPERERALSLEDGELWSRTISTQATAAATPTGVQLAQNIHESCRVSRSLGQRYTMRGCLESAHALLMSDLNRDFWQSLGDF